jgi:hypothetical protein
MITKLAPEQLAALDFASFAGATLAQVADWLYAAEPQFMAALESDIRVRGLLQPQPTGLGCLYQ